MEPFNVYDTIAMIRTRPAMYLGDHSLFRLRAFLDGCFYMAERFGLERHEEPDFGGLHDWVAKRYGWFESTAGWCGVILQECAGDEAKALDEFFNLVEEYRRTG